MCWNLRLENRRRRSFAEYEKSPGVDRGFFIYLSLSLRCAAQRRFCASAILLRASALRRRPRGLVTFWSSLDRMSAHRLCDVFDLFLVAEKCGLIEGLVVMFCHFTNVPVVGGPLPWCGSRNERGLEGGGRNAIMQYDVGLLTVLRASTGSGTFASI